jgi:hypothetical protein
MQSHVKAVAILHIVFGVLGIIGGLIAMLVLGGIAGIAAMADKSGDALIAVPILGAIATFVFALAFLLSIPGIIAGVGLLQFRPWARTLMIVLSAIHIFNFPVGTALGVYGLWALLAPETTALFNRQARYVS